MFQKLALFLILSPFLVSCQNSLTGEFSPAAKYDFVILYRLDPAGKVYVADTKVDATGNFKIDFGPEALKGTYRLVYDLPEDEHNFDFIYDGKESVILSFSENEGVIFQNGQNKILFDYLREMKTVQEEINSSLSSEKESMNEFFTRLKEIQTRAENASDNTFAHSFILANSPYIPDDFINKEVYEINRKSNFFDNFDFNAHHLQSSSFPLKIIDDYYHEYVTLKKGVNYRSVINDIQLELKNTDSNFQKNLLAEFWQNLIDENKNNAANYPAERYLISLANSLEDTELSQKLQQFKNLSIGANAPNFALMDYDTNKTLYDIEGSDYYILAFWSTECSHCMRHMPEIHERLKSISSEKIKTVAVGLELEEIQWREKILELPDFINLLAMGDSLDELVKDYNIRATPTFVVVDKDKRIIAKPSGVKNLYEIIDALEQYQKP